MTNDVGCKYKNNTGFQVLKYNNFAYDGGIIYLYFRSCWLFLFPLR